MEEQVRSSKVTQAQWLCVVWLGEATAQLQAEQERFANAEARMAEETFSSKETKKFLKKLRCY